MTPVLPRAQPGEIGLDADRLEVAYRLLAVWTTAPDPVIPAGAILVGRRGRVIEPRLFGRQGPEADAPLIHDDAMFLTASISKPVVYLGAMILVERGLLSLTDPVTRYVPEFANHDKGSVLVRQLFTHTSGLPDMLDDNVELRASHTPRQGFLDRASSETRLLFEPGTRVSYQSMGTAVVAEIIQRLTHKPFDEFLNEEVFHPLGMRSTSFGSRGFDPDRLLRVRTSPETADADWNWNSDYWRQLGSPWGGMFSTPDDLAVLCQMMLNGGVLGDARILSPATVRVMTTNRLYEERKLPESIARSKPWGLGWRLNHPGTPDSWGDLLGPNVYGHHGATGTLIWIDPDTEVFCVLLTSADRSGQPWVLTHLSNVVASAVL